MNKYIIIVLFVFVIAISVIRVVFIKSKPKDLKLTYEINAGIPFKWEYEIEDESIVKLERSFVDDKNKRQKGGIVNEHYIFSGLKEGTTTITFRTVSITGEYPDSNIEKNIVRVDKNLNVTLVKKQ